MLNQCILVGRIMGNPIHETVEAGKVKTTLNLDIKRSFKDPVTKNYESDVVTVNLGEIRIDDQYSNFLKEGCIIGIKGRIQQVPIEAKKGIINIPEVLAEKITFISSHMSD